MRHRLHYVGKNPDFEDLGQETLTLGDIADDDMIGPAAVVALKGDDGNEVRGTRIFFCNWFTLVMIRDVRTARRWNLIGLRYRMGPSFVFDVLPIIAVSESILAQYDQSL